MFCFLVLGDLVSDVETMTANSIWESEERVMPGKLQIAVSRASLTFQETFPDSISSYGSTSCIMSYL